MNLDPWYFLNAVGLSYTGEYIRTPEEDACDSVDVAY